MCRGVGLNSPSSTNSYTRKIKRGGKRVYRKQRFNPTPLHICDIRSIMKQCRYYKKGE